MSHLPADIHRRLERGAVMPRAIERAHGIATQAAPKEQQP